MWELIESFSPRRTVVETDDKILVLGYGGVAGDYEDREFAKPLHKLHRPVSEDGSTECINIYRSTDVDTK